MMHLQSWWLKRGKRRGSAMQSRATEITRALTMIFRLKSYSKRRHTAGSQRLQKHIIAADIVGRQEALIDLSARFRAPDSTAVMLELQALEKMRLEPEVFRSRMAAIDTRAVKTSKEQSTAGRLRGWISHILLRGSLRLLVWISASR